MEQMEAALQQAETAEIQAPKPDERSRDGASQFAHEEAMQKAQLGLLGKLWGARPEKPGNISGVILVILALYLGVILLFDILQKPSENFLYIFQE